MEAPLLRRLEHDCDQSLVGCAFRIDVSITAVLRDGSSLEWKPYRPDRLGT
jgi:hypothetical protein